MQMALPVFSLAERRSARAIIARSIHVTEQLTMATYTAVIEHCPATNLYVGYVPGCAGAHSQGETLDELQRNLEEVVRMLLEDGPIDQQGVFAGLQTITVD